MNSNNKNLLIKATPLLLFAIILTIFTTESSDQVQINQLLSTIEEQSQNIKNLEIKIQDMETELSKIVPNKGDTTIVNIDDFSNPDYDSGWVPLEPGKTCTLTHNQGVHIFVYVLGWDYTDEGGFVIHQNIVGDGHWDTPDGDSWGLRWCCSNDSQITLHRGIDDCFWDEFRVFIWKISET